MCAALNAGMADVRRKTHEYLSIVSDDVPALRVAVHRRAVDAEEEAVTVTSFDVYPDEIMRGLEGLPSGARSPYWSPLSIAARARCIARKASA